MHANVLVVAFKIANSMDETRVASMNATVVAFKMSNSMDVTRIKNLQD